MKKILTILTLMLAVTTGYSQSFQKNQIDLYAGIGLPPQNNTGGLTTIKRTIYVPPIVLGADYGLSKRISVGLSLVSQKYRSIHTSPKASDTSQFTEFAIGVRGAYHFVRKRKVDAYAGIALFGLISDYKFNGEPHNSYIIWPGIFTGLRYRFLPKYAAFAEVGLTYPLACVGVNMHL